MQAVSASFQLLIAQEISGTSPTNRWKDLLVHFEVSSSKIKLIMRYLGLDLIRILVVLDGNFVVGFLKGTITLFEFLAPRH